MTDANRCPTCGAERPENNPQGPCPRCLTRSALDTGPPTTGPGRGVELTVSLEPGSASTLARIAGSIGGIPHVLLRGTDAESGAGTIVEPPSPGMPVPAERAGKYEIFGEIARGGMGAVLRGRDVELGRELAVKVLLDSHRERPELIKRFVEEAQIGGQLQHPGVVPVYELGAFDDRRPFFTMKLVRGRTLAELLRERAEPTEDRPRFLSIFAQACQTMAYAHSRGVIHRDLKPSNIMVGSFGEVQVMDWGLAKVLPRGDAAAGQAPVHEAAIATARSDSDADASQAGSVLGTPAYMAPEQARGDLGQVDERADVFGLGAILCEVLTGEQAFAGRGALEILQKAGRGELGEALARLDGCGAEPELIDLAKHCLAAERAERPRDAGAVAGRITAYLAGVQERLRQAELARVQADARAEEERKRRKLALALAAAVVALMAFGGTGAAVYLQQRQAQAGRLAVALRDVVILRDQALADVDGDPSKWRSALTAAGRAGDLLGPLIDGAAQRRVRALRDEVAAAMEAAERDRELAARLVDIRGARADEPDGSSADAAYREAFRAAGLDPDALGAAELAAKVHGRPGAMDSAVAAALDDWAAVRRGRRKDPVGAARLTAVARAVDLDAWRDRLRDTLELGDQTARRAALLQLADSLGDRQLPAASFDMLGLGLLEAGERDRAEAVLRLGRRAHPRDAWLNHDLARALESLGRGGEAIRYYTAARAIRPQVGHALAHALEASGEVEEAIAVFRDLAVLRPETGHHLMCLGQLLKARGRAAEATEALARAEAALRERIRLRPDEVSSQGNLGLALHGQGRVDEAIAAFRAAIRLAPDDALAHFNLGTALSDQGRMDEAIAAFRAAIRLRPDDASTHFNLGNALRGQGKADEAIAAFGEASRLKPDFAEAHCNLGLTLQNQARYQKALAELRRGHELGSKRPDWRYPSAEWVRQAERLAVLESRLPEVLQGKDRPRDAGEGLQFADLALRAKRYGASAHLFAEALRADPGLAQEMSSANRYNAACAAALAGAGRGEDKLTDQQEMARWRKQALDWLRADLAFWSGQVDAGKPRAGAFVARTLGHWKEDADLEGVRDATALQALPEDERKACRAFWAEVDALLEKARRP